MSASPGGRKHVVFNLSLLFFVRVLPVASSNEQGTQQGRPGHLGTCCGSVPLFHLCSPLDNAIVADQFSGVIAQKISTDDSPVKRPSTRVGQM